MPRARSRFPTGSCCRRLTTSAAWTGTCSPQRPASTPEQLWQWAQGERPLRLPLIPGGDEWLRERNPALQFSIDNRPYLTALRGPAGPRRRVVPGVPSKTLRDLSAAVADALAALATPAEVRRVVELTIAMPAVMSREEIQAWMKDRTRPGEEKR